MEIYVDDMLINSRRSTNYLEDLSEMFGMIQRYGEDLSAMLGMIQRYGMKLNPLKCSFVVASGKVSSFIANSMGIETNPKKIEALRNAEALKTIKRGT